MKSFKVGNKVVCIDNEGVERWLTVGQEYTITYLHDSGDVAVDNIKNDFGWYPSRFKLKEENHAMTSQQKTKRVPFTHELWERWKEKGGKVIYKFTGKEVVQLTCFPNADTRHKYVALIAQGGVPFLLSAEVNLLLEVPVTTKRIPFNPELKNAKVFHLSEDAENGGKEVMDWWITKNKQLVCQWSNGTVGYANPSSLEMEIEEENA